MHPPFDTVGSAPKSRGSIHACGSRWWAVDETAQRLADARLAQGRRRLRLRIGFSLPLGVLLGVAVTLGAWGEVGGSREWGIIFSVVIGALSIAALVGVWRTDPLTIGPSIGPF